jgi:hypothetical protein
VHPVQRAREQARLLARRDAQASGEQPLQVLLRGPVRDERGAQRRGRACRRRGPDPARAGRDAARERRRDEVGAVGLRNQRLLWYGVPCRMVVAR